MIRPRFGVPRRAFNSRSSMNMKWTHAVVAALLALGLAACQKPKQVQPEPTAPAPTETDGASTTGIGTDAGAATAGAMSEAQRQALAALRARNVVYFEYDSSEIKPEYDAVITAHAQYLTQYRTARVRLEGHTDERGSREYNIGLGERRAQTVRRALLLQGVQETQVATVSYGEERPVAEGSDESAYAQNRRVELAQGE
jgi:peptidoglycan-associated lipoprotein